MKHTAADAQKSRLPAWVLAAYSLPEFGVKAMTFPSIVAIPAFYAKYTATSLAAIGVAMIVIKIINAVTDPLVGHLSDKTRSRFGPRKPWIACGALLAAVSALFLFNPSSDSGVWYFALSMLALYTGWSMIATTNFTWGAELSQDYAERSRITAYRSVAAKAGGLVFVLLPLLPYFPSSELGPEVMSMLSYVSAGALLIAVAVALAIAPQGIRRIEPSSSFGRFLKDVWRNPPFILFLSIFLFAGTATGVSLTVLVPFIDGYLGIGDKVPYVFIVGGAVSFLALPFWLAMIKRFGKHRVWAAGLMLQSALLPFLLLVPPGPEGFLPFLVISAIAGFGYSTILIAPVAMLADVIDYDVLKFRAARAGKLMSLYMLVFRIVVAIGSGVSFLLLDAFGWNMKGANDAAAMAGMQFVYVGIPVACNLVAILLILRWPLDQRRHSIISRRLQRRGAAALTARPA